jgi:hypothetical protein
VTFTVNMAALLDRAAKRAAQHGYPATPATRLPEPADKGSQVATVAGYPASGQADTDSRVTCVRCRNYSRTLHRCRQHRAALLQGSDIAPALAVLPQHCPGFQPELTP